MVMLWPAVSAAQIPFLSDLLGKATDVNAYYIRGALIGNNSFDRTLSNVRGFGTEVTFVAGSIPGGITSVKVTADTTWGVIYVASRDRGRRVDTTRTFTVKTTHDTTRFDVVNFDITVGFDMLSGFRGGGDSTFDIQGGLQELPMVASYATFVPNLLHWQFLSMAPYAGVRTGLVQLSNLTARAITSDTASRQVFSSSATSFQFGFAVGLLGRIGPISLFGEAQWTSCAFRNLEWTTGGSNLVPRRAPRGLNFSARTIVVGAQFTFNKH